MQSSSDTQGQVPKPEQILSDRGHYTSLTEAMERFKGNQEFTAVSNYLRHELDDDGKPHTKACTSFMHNRAPDPAREKAFQTYTKNAETLPLKTFLVEQHTATERLSNVGSLTPEDFRTLCALSDNQYWLNSQSNLPEFQSGGNAQLTDLSASAVPATAQGDLIDFGMARSLLYGQSPVTLWSVAQVRYYDDMPIIHGAAGGSLATFTQRENPFIRFSINSPSNPSPVTEKLVSMFRIGGADESLRSCRQEISGLDITKQGETSHYQVSNPVMDQILSDPVCSVPLQRAIRQLPKGSQP